MQGVLVGHVGSPQMEGVLKMSDSSWSSRLRHKTLRGEAYTTLIKAWKRALACERLSLAPSLMLRLAGPTGPRHRHNKTAGAFA